MFKLQMDQKGLELILKVDKNIEKFVIGDELRINQVLNNLSISSMDCFRISVFV